MQFFDLNIPYLESDKNVPDKKNKRDVRLKTMARAVELGYSGVAFNRTIKGAMSQSDGCTIPRFPISSLLKLHTSLSDAASFHRRLLGVPQNDAFRQYTRLTVVVETDAQSSALNSGNPVLKTYDLVAVTPLNQSLFDHACQSAQVDMISIDFGKRLPFRLKLSSIKAAIERGVYFEIMYSSFLEDPQVRRQLISSAKLLVEWTRGKNLVVSSAAPSFHELRGPNDVSNLLNLLGLSNERAKAAISKNCRLLIASALRKKQFYKEAIRVELLPSGVPTNRKEPWIIDNINWDPLSSGEGDLLLEDLAKSFADSGKASQTIKSINFTSLINSVPSHVKQGADNNSEIEARLHLSSNAVDFGSSSKDLEVPKATWNRPQESASYSISCPSLKGTTDDTSEQANCLSLSDSPKDEEFRFSPGAVLKDYNMSNTSQATLSPVRFDEGSLNECVAIQAEHMVVGKNIRETVSGDDSLNVESISASRGEVSVGSKNFNHDGVQGYTGKPESGAFKKTETGASLEVQLCVQSNSLHSCDSYLGNNLLQLKPDLVVEDASTECADKMAGLDSFVVKSNADGTASGVHQLKELPYETEQSDVLADEIMNVDFSIEKIDTDDLVLGSSPSVEEVDQVAIEPEHNEEHHSEVKTDSEESQLSKTRMQVDSFYNGKNGGNKLITKSMLAEAFMMETGKQAQEFVKAEHQSIDERNSVNVPSLPCMEVTKEHEQNEEHHSEVKTVAEESQFCDTMMQVDSSYQEKYDSNSLIAKSTLAEELMMETTKQVDEFADTEDKSIVERNSGNVKVKRSVLGPVLRFPFKRLLQLQFKRKGRTSMYKTKKRFSFL
ncbi:uncharacterized protein LOC141617411 isoform X2 [Silene latifolia]|uniref:uncharacterized protein LOC141617411 isoform X2 n=1 Tax=Silene latifolia TaxID=37657 RepID=UPI003D76BACD